MPMPKPKTEGRYLKAPKAGQSLTFRILADPVVFWQAWKTDGEGKQRPVRKPDTLVVNWKRGEYDEINKYGTPQKPAYCQAFPVIGPNGDVQIFTASQKTILDGLFALDNNKKWGALTGYDVVVSCNEDGKGYTVTPEPKEPLSAEAAEKWAGLVRNGFDMSVLVDLKDPFAVSGGSAESDEIANPNFDEDVPSF